MVFFLIFLGIIIFILFIFLIICASTIRVKIAELEIESNNRKEEIIKTYLFYIQIYFLDTIKIFQLKVNKERVKKITDSKIIKKLSMIDIKNIEKRLKEKNDDLDIKNLIKLVIKEIQPQISKLQLEVLLGTRDCIITSFITCTVGVILSLLLGRIAINEKQIKYKIVPIYNQNIIKIKLNCIIHLKMVHIMNIIYIFLKQGSVKNNERTSNRRAYDYSHEQYTRYGRRKYHYRGTN